MWKLKDHYHIHKCPSNVPVLSQIDPVQALRFHFLRNETTCIHERLLSNINNIISSNIRDAELVEI